MFDGFVRVAAATPTIRVADCDHNAEQIISLIKRAAKENIRFICFTELCVTGYTCGDLFLQDALLESAKNSLRRIVSGCEGLNVLAAVGLPVSHNGKLFNTAAVFCGGKILSFVPKTFIPNYGEFYELRHFSPALPDTSSINFNGDDIPFGTKIIFQCANLPEFSLAVEICEDLWIPHPPCADHATAGATIIANLSASSETIGKAAYRRSLVTGQSARLLSAYVYADAGRGESSSDMVFSGHNIVCENGLILAESPPFGEGWAVSEIDLPAVSHDRRKTNTFGIKNSGYTYVPFSLEVRCDALLRIIDPAPFIPKDSEKAARCEEILKIQSAGLAKRLEYTGCKAVVGVSGGLDSTLALIVAARACDLLEIPRNILAVTMPCFGTSERTKNNALALCDALEIPCREIDISESVQQHLRDIGHSAETHDTVYENAQARVRTLVLMDLANQSGGIVVGSGDLSELALGWATYNGDHMSMYGVNAGVPKTLVRHIIKYVAETNEKLERVLDNILETPISPELLPHDNGEILQRTEDILGPYELHDFFLYHVLRWGRKPRTIFNLACNAFHKKYTPDEIRDRLKLFYSRFFSQQFKRNCLPDGAKIGSVTLSPRGDWRMPSDAVYNGWLRDIR